MAHRLIHHRLPQEVRFPNRPTAEQYADRFGGGQANWTIVVAGPTPVTSPSDTSRNGFG